VNNVLDRATTAHTTLGRSLDEAFINKHNNLEQGQIARTSAYLQGKMPVSPGRMDKPARKHASSRQHVQTLHNQKQEMFHQTSGQLLGYKMKGLSTGAKNNVTTKHTNAKIGFFGLQMATIIMPMLLHWKLTAQGIKANNKCTVPR